MSTIKDVLEYSPVELSFGTSGLRGLVVDMTDLECYINTAGFLRFLRDEQQLADGATIFVAGDLRDSTPRILSAVIAAIRDGGYVAEYIGLVPTPALANAALRSSAAGIMVTGSHIPADRNGIKFYKLGGEILKDDEAAIRLAVAKERAATLATDASKSPFDGSGMLKRPIALTDSNGDAAREYMQRYTSVFSELPLIGKEVVVYQHSAVGRDMLVDLMSQLGASVQVVGRSDVFVSIDTENVTSEDRAYFKQVIEQHPGAFAIVSTDGDSDRPFVIDEAGVFHRGDELGAVVAKWLDVDMAAIPISSNDAVGDYLQAVGVNYEFTRIGSPYVISAMDQARERGGSRVAGWEVNGGFLLSSDFEVYGKTLLSLPTRDAFLPIIVALVAATERQLSVSALFADLPARFTQAGLIDNFPPEVSRSIVDKFSSDTPDSRATLESYFDSANGFDAVTKIDNLDGIRIFFDNADIAHLRPSGNAPQLRIYSVADSQERADHIVRQAISEGPEGILRQLERDTHAK